MPEHESHAIRSGVPPGNRPARKAREAGSTEEDLVRAVELIKTVDYKQDALRIIIDPAQQLKELMLQSDHVARNLHERAHITSTEKDVLPQRGAARGQGELT